MSHFDWFDMMMAARSASAKPEDCKAEAMTCAAAFEVAVREPAILTFAVGFDETEMFLPLVQSDTKCFAQG